MTTLRAIGLNELQDIAQLFAGEQQFSIVARTPHGVNGNQSPTLYAYGPQEVAYLIEFADIAPVNAGNDIPRQSPVRSGKTYGTHCTIESQGMLPQPIVIIAESVETDRHGRETRLPELRKSLRCECESIGNHAPRIASLVELSTYVRQVGTHERFATRDDDHHVVRIDMGCDGIDDTQEILRGHIGRGGGRSAVAAAMQTVYVATERGLPEQLLQGVQLLQVVATQSLQFQCYALS